jgi:hypothetical protein
MGTSAYDFTAWGLDADWPALRWIEPINGRRGQQLRGLRLGHADDSAMVLTCTYPRTHFDAEARACGFDPEREIAFETTYTQVNLALHQMREPAERPEGLIGSLVSHASEGAANYRDWTAARWGEQDARTITLANWQSGFTTDDPAAYVVVHACGVPIGDVRLTTFRDLSGYEPSRNQVPMHWELWSSHPDVGYDDLVSVLAG